jgi:hypothetical protein
MKAGVSPKRWMYSWTCLTTSSGSSLTRVRSAMRKIGIFLLRRRTARMIERGAFVELVLAFQVPVQQDRRVRGVGLDQRQTVLGVEVRTTS